MGRKKPIGQTDSPIGVTEEDLLGITNYANALSAFIRECDTPMTIAIQGDWGSGKTSIMNLVKSQLSKKEVIPVWFNTWQFSQFNMSDNLTFTFLSYLVTEVVNASDDTLEKAKIFAKNKSTLFFDLVKFALNVTTGHGAALQEFKDLLQKNPMQAIDGLKKDFQAMVNMVCGATEEGEQNTKRVVVFVDDLDRLEPLRAVELLEVLKIFFDCKNCVFVLAIDYEVVSQGINQKYKGTLDEIKSRKFFEKIIQVPFKMPIAHYNIERFVGVALEKLQIDKKYKSICINLIKNSIGCNPRTMKRAFNAFSLLQKVQGNMDGSQHDMEKVILFASLCLQLTYEDVYNYMVLHMNEENDEADAVMIDVEFFETIKNAGTMDGEEKYKELYEIIQQNKQYEEEVVTRFLVTFSEIFSKNDKIDQELFDKMREILLITTMTSTGVVEVKTRKNVTFNELFKEGKIDEDTRFVMTYDKQTFRAKMNRSEKNGEWYMALVDENDDFYKDENGNPIYCSYSAPSKAAIDAVYHYKKQMEKENAKKPSINGRMAWKIVDENGNAKASLGSIM